MAPLDLLYHLLNFALPAFAVGLLCALLGRVLPGRSSRAPSLWTQAAVNVAVGISVLVAGIVWFGRDGTMATYAALVLACGTSQWLVAGGWRR